MSVAPQRRGRLRCDFATVRDPDQGEVAFVVPASVQLTCKRVGRPLEGIVGGKGGGGRKDLAQAGGNKPANVKKIFDKIKQEILKLT